jgi:hypothetical protein
VRCGRQYTMPMNKERDSRGAGGFLSLVFR